MLGDIEKTFDTAFFNAIHQLKMVSQMVLNLEDVALSDEMTLHMSQAMDNVNDHLSTMAFCFSQLMCKSILFSENAFILKERFQQCQQENFHLKSDKSFLDFMRKVNLFNTNSSSSNASATVVSSNSPPTPEHRSSSVTVEETKTPRSPSDAYKRQSSKPIRVKSKRESAHLNKSKSKQLENLLYYPPNSEKIVEYAPMATTVESLDDCLLNNGNRDYLRRSSTFRIHHLNENTFKSIYRNFKEVECINELNYQNIALQKENVVLKSKLCNYRLVVRYLNNQLSGRIQQIQLLHREKDANFEQVWSDLESEILLNKFKTIVQALQSNSTTDNSGKPTQYNSLMEMFHSSLPSSPSIKYSYSSKSKMVNRMTLSSSSSTVPTTSESQSIEQSSNVQNSSENKTAVMIDKNSDEICDLDVDQLEEDLLRNQLKNFRSSWFHLGMLRFVFLNLNEEAIGVSIIGGKEYGLPIIISTVHPNTPASRQRALNPGDIVLSVNFVDMTDLTHEEAVNLLTNLSGNCRLGVIFFKPEEQSSIQPAHSETDESDSKLTSPVNLENDTTLHHMGISLIDMPNLLHNYYRSVFNTFLSMPFSAVWQSNHCTTSSSDESDVSHDHPLSTYTLSECDLNYTENQNQKSEEKFSSSIVGQSTTNIINGDSMVLNNNTTIVNRKAFPGTATRLSSENKHAKFI